MRVPHSEHSLEFASVRVEGEEPPMKRFKHLSRVSSLIEQEEIAQDTEASREIPKQEEERDRYLDILRNNPVVKNWH